MTELSLHIMDIVQNSITAQASRVKILIEEDRVADELSIQITDNGMGMTKEVAKKATDSFFTSRHTHKVGLGLPLFKQATEQCDGFFGITSKPGSGTTVTAIMEYSNIDRQPIGDIAGVVALLVSSNPGIEFVYEHRTAKGIYVFDTNEVKQVLEDVSVADPKVMRFIKDMICENLKEIKDA
jgi:sensor histidine kinase regulating citrate/malate metabolism